MITSRVRDAEGSRNRILDAAAEEFAAHGFAGARVEAIARRAGLNKQLISHHFGGKEGLYEAVLARRLSSPGGELTARGSKLGELFDRAIEDPAWTRMLLWEALEGGPVVSVEARRARYRQVVDRVRRSQADGVLPADEDPELLLLSMFGAALYPVLLPQVAEMVTGLRPDDPAFERRYRRHLSRLASTLGAGGPRGRGRGLVGR
jgi:TetR/AcrR family transcriptional regulator